MYAFFSIESYEFVRDNKLTLAQALKAEYVYNVPHAEVVVTKVDGLNICFWDIPF